MLLWRSCSRWGTRVQTILGRTANHLTAMTKKKSVSNKLAMVGDYGSLLSSVSELLQQARRTSARTVNAILTATYWEIGRRIVEFEQAGEKKAEYGEALLMRLSSDLTARFGRGFQKSNLFQMRAFYLGYPNIFQTLSGKSGSTTQDGIFRTLSGISPTSSAKSAIVQTASAISATPLRRFTLSHLAQHFPSPGLTTSDFFP
jgi:hypothetical protein